MSDHKKSEKYVKFLIYVVIVVLLNVVGATLFFRIDLTKNKVFSISSISKKTVSSLTEPLTINVFFSNDLPAPHNNTKRYLQDLLKEYELHANKKFFNYSFYDISSAEDENDKSKSNKKLAETYGINPVQIRMIEKDEVKAKNVYMGLVIIHGDLIEKIPALTDTDMTEYTLTSKMMKLNNKISVLHGLKEKIQTELVMSSSLKDVAPYMKLNDLPQIPSKVEEAVQKINNKNYSCLTYKYTDSSIDPSAKDKITKHNLITLKWNDIENKVKAGEGSIGLIMTYGDKSIDVPLLNVVRLPIIGNHYELIKMNELESLINNSIESLIDINEKIGYLSDHDTMDHLGANPMMGRKQSEMNNFNSLVSQNYSIKDVRLKSEGIPNDINSMIIANPTEPFNDYELYQIDQALMAGKSLVLFLDSFKEIEQPNQQFGFNMGPSYQPIDTGLEKLLKFYGISIAKSYVMDENCFKQNIPQQFGGGERKIYFAPLIQNKYINNDIDFMKNIKGLVCVKASPISLDKAVTDKLGLKASPLFSSSEQSWEMKDQINLNPMFLQPPKDNVEKKSYALSYVLEGSFPSYYDGKQVPEKPADTPKPDDKAGKPEEKTGPTSIEKQGGFLAKSKPARIIVVASAEMLKDTMLDEEGQSPNATFVLNSIDAANNKIGIAQMRSKKQSFNPLKLTSPAFKIAIKAFNIAGLPVIVVFFGLVVWFKRKSHKKRIQMMFQK